MTLKHAKSGLEPPTVSLSPLDIPEILEHILSYLQLRTIVRSVRAVCRQWYIISYRVYPRQVTFDDNTLGTCSRVLELVCHEGHLHWICNNSQSAWETFRDMLKRNNDERESNCTVNNSNTILNHRRGVVMPLREFRISVRFGMFFDMHLSMALPHLGALTSLHIQSLNELDIPIERILRACPLLVTVAVEGNGERVNVFDHSEQMSSIDFAHASWDMLEPQPDDPPLRLQNLTVRQCHVSHLGLVSVLSISPQLQQLALIGNTLGEPSLSWHFSHDGFLAFLGRVCPRLHKIHYSFFGYQMNDNHLQMLIQGHARVTEWSFLHREFRPALIRELLQVRNVVTSLEIAQYKSPGTDIHVDLSLCQHRFSPKDMATVGLHEFLCASPLLLHLKTDQVGCLIQDIELFPLQLQTTNYKPGTTLANIVVTTASVGLPRVWACRNLQSLSLYFTRSFNRSTKQLGASRSQVVFGYLSRVCPKLERLHLVLNNLRLNLVSGMCLLSRLDRLKQLTLDISGYSFVWEESLDLSWMARHPLPLGRRLAQDRDMLAWRADLKREPDMILLREKYLKVEKDNSSLRGEEFDVRSWGDDLAYPLSHLGTFTDVHNCLREMAAKEGQCWPRLEQVWATSSEKGTKLSSKTFADAVNKVRPSTTTKCDTQQF
ncbi:hypothetical protein BG003_005504 [Podila horticola]|nr:hypothetical protein BG003_005504 [Podila horticola]